MLMTLVIIIDQIMKSICDCNMFRLECTNRGDWNAIKLGGREGAITKEVAKFVFDFLKDQKPNW